MVERPEQFAHELRQQQERLASADQRAQKKIDKLFEDTQKLLAKFLSSRQVQDLSAELFAARTGGS